MTKPPALRRSNQDVGNDMNRTIAVPFVGFLMWGLVATDVSVAKPNASAQAQEAATAQRNKQEQAAVNARNQAVNDVQTALNDAQLTLDEIALKAQNVFKLPRTTSRPTTSFRPTRKPMTTASSRRPQDGG